MSYAIKNKRTGRFVYATDYRYSPPHQMTSNSRALIYSDFEAACMATKIRQCSMSYYEIVLVEIKEQEHE